MEPATRVASSGRPLDNAPSRLFSVRPRDRRHRPLRIRASFSPGSPNEQQVDEPAWSARVDHGYSIIFDLAMGGGFPDGVCGCMTPTDQTTSGGTMTVRYVAVYARRPQTPLSASHQRHSGMASVWVLRRT
jgi:hypothetical protein